VEAAHQVPDPAVALRRVVDVPGQPVRQVGQAVGQRIAERDDQAREDQDRPDRDDGHGRAAAPDPPLHEHHERVEDQRDEPGHHHQKQHVPQPVGELGGQVGDGQYGHGNENGRQRNPARGGRAAHPGTPGGLGPVRRAGFHVVGFHGSSAARSGRPG
jgi:hypothetical protein